MIAGIDYKCLCGEERPHIHKQVEAYIEDSDPRQNVWCQETIYIEEPNERRRIGETEKRITAE